MQQKLTVSTAETTVIKSTGKFGIDGCFHFSSRHKPKKKYEIHGLIGV